MLNNTESTHESHHVRCVQHQEGITTGTVTIRRAVIKTESIDVLSDGIMCGQACGVDLLYDNSAITSHDLAHLFTQTMNSDEPEALNVGFLIGVVDALLRARKTYPRGW